MNLKGKVVIITGSSRGIGKAIAKDLAQRGASIVLNGRNEERLNDTAAELSKINVNILAICSDVSTIEGSQLLIDKSIDRFGQLDILINNVGVSMRGKIAELNPGVYKQVFESNVLGTVYPTIPSIEHLRKTKGSIVFISSLAGIRGLPFLSAYSASKMALRAVAESIRVEEHKNKIHVGLIYVGMTEIVHNKETIAADGSKLTLMPRQNNKVLTPEYVAKKVYQNIKRKKFITVMTSLGRINVFLRSFFPALGEKIIINNIHKFEEGGK